MHDPESAADAVQDTFTKLWRIRWRLGLMENAQGYAIRTLQHICLDKLRHNHVVQNARMETELLDQEDNGIYERLSEAIAALPERQRMLIELRYRDQLSSVEMAEVMGMTVSNVDTIMSRTYATLRKILEENNKEVRK